MTQLIKNIYSLKNQRDDIQEEIERLKLELSEVNSKIDQKEKELLSQFFDNSISELEVDGLVGFKQGKRNVGYTNEADVISLLKCEYDGSYIKQKISESLDKNSLKKALKSDSKLRESLSPFIVNNITEYVVVTTVENRAKMLEYIENGNK